ncbi:hypothetical protein Cgig2_010925 [Carnegiea gigantea]|uniref:Reverse transcriptase domain-containing protein n=1 Tax=Carnegiea gigantea TaxID=171969 RepID=A0A9Q1K3C1_9CARY|nr:hypothetical protein Cgig2_010925 [Carnegiea gigantea]
MRHTSDELPGSRNRSRPRGLKVKFLAVHGPQFIVREHPMLKKPPPMTSALKPHNAWKYCEFHEQNGHTTAECRELRKTLHELVDRGQINHFLKRGPCFLQSECEPARPELRDEECSTKVVPTITEGYPEEMKVACVIVRRILIDTRSSMDTITWDSLKKLTYLGRDIVPLEVNPIGIIRLPLLFRDKWKSKNLEVDFLVVDVPTAYNIILERPTLLTVKAVIAPYLLQLQFEVDDGSMGTMHGDQHTARECYLVRKCPLMEWTSERGSDGSLMTGKKPQTEPLPPSPVVEALVIHTTPSVGPNRPHPEAVESTEQVPLEEDYPDRTAQIGREIKADTCDSLISLLREYQDAFVFGLEETPSIDSTVMEHWLNVDPLYKPVIQKKRHMGLERAAVATAEVQKLLEAGFIREC